MAGVPVNVVAKIQPAPPGELNTTFGVLINNNKITLERDGLPGGGSEHVLDYVYGPDSSSREMFERSLAPTVYNFVEGVNIGVVGLGESTSGNEELLGGDKDGGDKGLVAMVVETLFEALREKERKYNKNTSSSKRPFRYRVRARFLEMYNEELNDLLDPGNASLAIEESEERGVHVAGLSGRWVDGPEDLVDLYHEGRAAGVNMETDVGPAGLRATSIFSIELSQNARVDGEVLEFVSHYSIVSLPAAEKLAEDPAALRVREGPTLNRALLSVVHLAKALVDPSTKDFANYQESKLTALLTDVMGGNALTVVLATLSTTNFETTSAVLKTTDILTQVENYPVVNDARVRALLRRSRMATIRARDELAAGGGGSGMGGSGGGGDGDGGGSMTEKQLMKIHQLEGRIIKDNLEKIKLREDKEKILSRLSGLKVQYEKLVESKAELQAELISSEEERLRVSKALIDLQIENNSLEEDGETKNFELVNKVLALENDVMESEMKLQTQEQLLADMRDALDAAAEESRELQIEYVALKTNFLNAKSEAATEVAKNQELGIELLNLVNAKRALEDDKVQLERRIADLLNMQGDADAMLQAQKDERSRIEEEVRDLREQSAVLKAELLKQQIALEQEVLDLESQKVGVQKRMVDLEKAKVDDVASLRRQLEAAGKKHAAELSRVQDASALLQRDLNKANRAARTAEENLVTTKHELRRVQHELDSKEADLEKAQDRYRSKLKSYMADVSSLSRTLGRADDMAASRMTPRTSRTSRRHGHGKSKRKSKRGGRSRRHRRSGSYSDSEYSGDGKATARAAALANANLHAQQNMDALIRELADTYEAKEVELKEDLDRLRRRNRELVHKSSVLHTAYKNLRTEVEDEGLTRISAPSVAELEDSVHASDLKTEVERDLEIALDAALVKAEKAESALTRTSEQHLSALEKHQQTVLDLQARNAEVASELEALRVFRDTVEASAGSAGLEDVHEALRNQIDALHSTVTSGEKEELLALRREVEELRSATALASARAHEKVDALSRSSNGNLDELRRALKEFILKTQSKLEAERSRLIARATLAEEQLAQIQLEMTRARATMHAHATPVPRNHHLTPAPAGHLDYGGGSSHPEYY